MKILNKENIDKYAFKFLQYEKNNKAFTANEIFK